MNKAISAHNLGATVGMLLIVVMLLMVALVFWLQTGATTGDQEGNPASPAMSGTGGSNFADDPYIDRHAEVVARYK